MYAIKKKEKIEEQVPSMFVTLKYKKEEEVKTSISKPAYESIYHLTNPLSLLDTTFPGLRLEDLQGLFVEDVFDESLKQPIQLH